MIIRNITHSLHGRKSILSAEIVWRGSNGKRLYFVVDRSWSSYIYPDASPFLAALLLPCMRHGEDIEIQGSVSEELFNATIEIMNLCESWHLGLRRIRVVAQTVTPDIKGGTGRACFFSGGVDSFYTYLTQKENKKNSITHFFFVHGFDILLDNVTLFNRVARMLRYVARSERLAFVVVKTNLRQFTDRSLFWDYAHGGAMAAVALALRRGFQTVYVSSGTESSARRPYGIHPDLDPLWSTEHMQIRHVGTEARRIDKIRHIARFDIVRKTLRVCWRNPEGSYNCCHCEKCMRTMLSLYAIGVLKRCKTFPAPIDLNTLKRLYVYNNQIRYFQESLDELRSSTRNPALVSALEQCIVNNRHRTFIRRIITGITHAIGNCDAKYLQGTLFYMLSKRGYL